MGYIRRVVAFVLFTLATLWLILFNKVAKPTLIYASSTPPTVPLVGYLASIKWKCPFWFEAVDVWPQVPIGMGIIKNRTLIFVLHKFVDFLYQKAQKIVVLSEGMFKQVNDRGIDNAKIILSHNGTEPDVFFPFQTKEKIKNNDNQCNLIYAGALGKANAVENILFAFQFIQQNLAPKHIQFHLYIYGTGSECVYLKDLAIKLNLAQIYFYEPLPKSELNQIFNQMDIALISFANYKVLEANSANKFYDYLAAGLPVVLNYKGWQAQYLSEYHCGLSSTQNDIQGFANNIFYLATHTQERNQMAQNARHLAKKLFDRKDLAANLYQIFTIYTEFNTK